MFSSSLDCIDTLPTGVFINRVSWKQLTYLRGQHFLPDTQKQCTPRLPFTVETGYSTPGIITLALDLVQPDVLGTPACRCFAEAACPLTVLTNKGQYTQTFQERKSGLEGGDLPCGFFKYGRALKRSFSFDVLN